MADFVYGDSFGDVSRQETGRRALFDNRYFQGLAHNRAVGAQRMAQRNAQINSLQRAAAMRAQAAQQQQALQSEVSENTKRRQANLQMAALQNQGANQRNQDTVGAGLAEARMRFSDRARLEGKADLDQKFQRAMVAINNGADPNVILETIPEGSEERELLKSNVEGLIHRQAATNEELTRFADAANLTMSDAKGFAQHLQGSLTQYDQDENFDLRGALAKGFSEFPRLGIDPTTVLSLAVNPDALRPLVTTIPISAMAKIKDQTPLGQYSFAKDGTVVPALSNRVRPLSGGTGNARPFTAGLAPQSGGRAEAPKAAPAYDEGLDNAVWRARTELFRRWLSEPNATPAVVRERIRNTEAKALQDGETLVDVLARTQPGNAPVE